jgi:predicted DNA-binding transcriptional regulator YafY
MPRGDQVTRQWRLIRLLEKTRKGYTFEELARELECSARTVMRDLEGRNRGQVFAWLM